MKFAIHPGRVTISQLEPGKPVPAWATSGPFHSITHTSKEISIICEEAVVPEDVKRQKGFLCLEILGPFPMDAVGVLESFLQPLAKAAVPIFAVSTYNTDYILVHKRYEKQALEALQRAGHELVLPG